MVYPYNNYRNDERRQYEDWRRYGRERGFLDRMSDEVRAWFGDEEAEQRRQMDQQADSSRNQERRFGFGGGMGAPDWQSRDYSGSSPRGSHMEEQGRYDEPGYQSGRFGSMAGMRRHQPTEPKRYMPGYGSERHAPRFFEESRDFESMEPWEQRRHEQSRYEGSGAYQGMYAGRGPRNYQRADERISDEIHQCLTRHPDLDATDIEVMVELGVVTLRGAVESRYAKRLTEDIVEDVYGVKEVHNELRVNRGDFRNMGTAPGNENEQYMRNRMGTR